MGLQHTGEGVVKLVMGAIAGECAIAPGTSHAHLGRHTVDMVASIGGGALVRQRLVYAARRDTYRGVFGTSSPNLFRVCTGDIRRFRVITVDVLERQGCC